MSSKSSDVYGTELTIYAAQLQIFLKEVIADEGPRTYEDKFDARVGPKVVALKQINEWFKQLEVAQELVLYGTRSTPVLVNFRVTFSADGWTITSVQPGQTEDSSSDESRSLSALWELPMESLLVDLARYCRRHRVELPQLA